MFLKKKYYIAGWEIDADNPTDFLVNHCTDKKGHEFFCQLQSGLIVENTSNDIYTIYKCEFDGEEIIKEVKYEQLEIPNLNLNENKIFLLKKDSKGIHNIGGKIPENLILPHYDNMKTPFQYIGTISGGDPSFKWIGIDKLNIIYPLCEYGNNGIYLDYANPNIPIILNPETFYDSSPNPELDSNRIEFTQSLYSTTNKLVAEDFEDNNDLLLCGVPLWYQNPEMPRCPKTGELLKFLCTINSDPEIKIVGDRPNLLFDDYLIFGDVGHLFVFYQPDSKVLFLTAQW
ncbi:MAG: hypothetical protein JWM44_869 [Bacilli bacterium]|nr:hypothetical protein [Bacilli bacterium]